MAGRVGVYLEVITCTGPVLRSEHLGAESHHVFVRCVEFIYPEIQMDLLCWVAVRPVWGNVVRGELNADLRLAVEAPRDGSCNEGSSSSFGLAWFGSSRL